MALALFIQTLDQPPGGNRVTEDLKTTAGDQRANICQFQAETNVGIIPAKTSHGFLVTQPGEWFVEDLSFRIIFDDADHQPLDQRHDIVPVHKAHFHIELRKLRLAVAALIFIAETARNLKIAVITGDHNQLLELLRALRQRIKPAGMDAAGHQIISRSLRRSFEQNRGFNFHKTLVVEKIADVTHHVVTQDNITLQPLAAQIKIAVAQTQSLVH
jgi:hypothetical protein